jgi:hypothetical protein
MVAPPVDSGLKRLRLLYVLAESLEKFCRVQQILKNEQIFIAGEHAEAQPANAIETLIGFLDLHRQTIFKSSNLIAEALRGVPLNEAQDAVVIAAVRILTTAVLRVHEMLLLLPREAAKPQASFLLRSCFATKDLEASIVLTNYHSAYEYRFEDVLEKVEITQEEREALKEGGNVLCQAFADKNNPLAWAVLAHEYGHVINDRDAITEKILEIDNEAAIKSNDRTSDARQKPDYRIDVVGETVADLIAARVLGPASLIPILFVEMMQPRLRKPEKKSGGHPPTPLRVRMVRQYLQAMEVTTSDFEEVFKTYEFDYSRKLDDMEPNDRETLQRIASSTEEFLSPLAEKISSIINSLKLPRFEESNAKRANDLKDALAGRQPISSVKQIADKQIFDRLSSLRVGESTPEAAYEVLANLDEVPVEASEILTAGWLYKLSTFEGELKKLFPGGDEQEADITGYLDYVNKTDGLLLKSLELADVHGEVLGRMTAP